MKFEAETAVRVRSHIRYTIDLRDHNISVTYGPELGELTKYRSFKDKITLTINDVPAFLETMG
jgi:hypothetical protein